MDPYLENHWGDVHARLVTYSCDQIQPRLPRDLRARMQERLLIQPTDDKGRDVIPDVRVVERPRLGRNGGGVAVEVDEPATPHIYLLDERETETFIEIVDARTREHVVTVIEILSLSNKRGGRDTDKYVQEREERAAARISLVEIDLLRDGKRELGDRELNIPRSDRSTYAACVHRGWRRIAFEVYPLPLRTRLPKIRIPLRETDPDVVLDLQAILDLAYANGGYDDTNYAVEPVPPLGADDAAWADAVLREKGMR